MTGPPPKSNGALWVDPPPNPIVGVPLNLMLPYGWTLPPKSYGGGPSKSYGALRWAPPKCFGGGTPKSYGALWWGAPPKSYGGGPSKSCGALWVDPPPLNPMGLYGGPPPKCFSGGPLNLMGLYGGGPSKFYGAL